MPSQHRGGTSTAGTMVCIHPARMAVPGALMAWACVGSKAHTPWVSAMEVGSDDCPGISPDEGNAMVGMMLKLENWCRFGESLAKACMVTSHLGCILMLNFGRALWLEEWVIKTQCKCSTNSLLGGGFNRFCYFHPESWGSDPIWLLFFQAGWNIQLVCISDALYDAMLTQGFAAQKSSCGRGIWTCASSCEPLNDISFYVKHDVHLIFESFTVYDVFFKITYLNSLEICYKSHVC